MRLGAEHRFAGAALQLRVAHLIAVAELPAPAIIDILARPGAERHAGLEFGGGRVGTELHVLRRIEAASRTHAYFPFLSHRRRQHGCCETYCQETCEQTNEFHTVLFLI